jgi:hypothetical protein
MLKGTFLNWLLVLDRIETSNQEEDEEASAKGSKNKKKAKNLTNDSEVRDM